MSETGNLVFDTICELADTSNEKARQPLTSTVTETIETVDVFKSCRPSVTTAEARLMQSNSLISSKDSSLDVSQTFVERAMPNLESANQALTAITTQVIAADTVTVENVEHRQETEVLLDQVERAVVASLEAQIVETQTKEIVSGFDVIEPSLASLEPKLYIDRKSEETAVDVSESLLSVKVEPSREHEADDAGPIVKEEDEPKFSIKRKAKINPVEDVALEGPANKTESGINDTLITKDEVASELISSTPSKPFGSLSNETTLQTIESGVVAKPRKKSIKKTVEEPQSQGGSIPQQATTTDISKKPRKEVIKKGQSDKSVADLDLKSKSSKL